MLLVNIVIISKFTLGHIDRVGLELFIVYCCILSQHESIADLFYVVKLAAIYRGEDFLLFDLLEGVALFILTHFEVPDIAGLHLMRFVMTSAYEHSNVPIFKSYTTFDS